MTIEVALEHRTVYDFDRPVALAPHVVRLRPAPHCRTPIRAYSLRIGPEDHFVNWQQDPFGNFEARLVFPDDADQLSITVDLVADLTAINPFDFFLEDDAETLPWVYEPALFTDLEPYLRTDPAGPLLSAWLASAPTLVVDGEPMRTIDHLVALNQRLAGDIGYSIRMEPGVQDPETTLGTAIGSCRDSAWLLVQILRHLGMAARFVSGYLVQLTADQEPLEGPGGPDEDFTDLHAWTEVFLPGAGWVGMDPTSGLFAGEGHIPLACTPSPASAAPIEGATGPCEVTFSFSNTVTRSHEDPRVTLPYTPQQWAAIDSLGHLVDDRLHAGDVRLTMGGEPTFVSIDDMAGAEWSTEADGPAKRALADELTARLVDAFAPTAVVHRGQGKWYPGEPLPRWQNAIVWRTDGVPMWDDHELLAEPSVPGTDDPTSSLTFVLTLADELGLPDDTIRAGWEDPLHQVWREATEPPRPGERTLPPFKDLDPEDPRLASESGRRSITDELDERAGRPTGWVLPLFRSLADDSAWVSPKWTVRRAHLFLLPGDSPMGYRLPIQSLTTDLPPTYERSPFARLRPFPDERETGADDGPASPDRVVVTDDVPPTALCAEVRDGHLHVFLPPLEDGAHAVELLRGIEATAKRLDQAVVIEGYPIPSDPRLRSVVVAPDPGVIEVNVQPASDWNELCTITRTVHEQARLTRLGTEKFDLDGTHTGTGGGNHITLGGPTPADSPLLRRPDLLRSLVTYWQHHPSLSYLFSGRFIGPSSQAPRVDEARDDRLHELETSFAELDRLADDGSPEGPAPWVVDRLLRHLLTDLTGNTHRAEFCIDKLFSPDSERGRLGLLELRGFEMPPHPEMALAQALLVRTIVARCWDDPYRHRPTRWGTALHDRYLLPHFVEADIAAVADDLARHGYDFDPAWVGPFLEFRFPRHGTTTVAGVTLEVRGAIEPWHVLGEEATGSGMARYVDSSVERIQLRADGLVDGRHVVTCNGSEVPFVSTEQPGTGVAGIRFKAWAPPSGLHPTLPIDSPLTFDVVDRWTGRSLGGCRYHVVHPGGRSYDTFPVNAVEAESRRQRRFESMGHTPGRPGVLDDRPHRHPEYPATLDLRRTDG